MRYKKLPLIALLWFGLGLVVSQAQTSVSAAGGNASASAGSVSYSVGQVFYTTPGDTNFTISLGVQQPYEIWTVTGFENTTATAFSISAYPIPTTDFVQLRVENTSLPALYYQLFDIHGKLLQHENLNGEATQINMSQYVSATYFIRIFTKNTPIKEFKIVKH